MKVLRVFYLIFVFVQVDECFSLVPVSFDAFTDDDADITDITMLDNLISSVCAGERSSHLCCFAAASVLQSCYCCGQRACGPAFLNLARNPPHVLFWTVVWFSLFVLF